MFWVPEYYNTLDSIAQTKTVHFFNAPLPPGITSGKDWFQHSKGVYSEKHNCCVKSSNKATCRSRTDMLLVLNFEKLNVWTPQIHRPRCYYITRKFFMQAEKSRSGANDFFSGRKYSDTYSVTLRGEISVWCYYIMPLCFMQTESRRPLLRSTAPCERISESTSTSTPKVRKQISQSLLLRNHHLFLIMEQELQGGMWARTHNNGLVLVTPSPGDAAEATSLNMNNRISLSEPLR